MTDKSVTGGSAPPYDQNPQYTSIGTTPAQPMMQHDAYNQPTSPPPQVFPPHQPHDPKNNYAMSQAHYAQDPNQIHQHQGQGQGQGQPMGSPGSYNEQQKGSYYGHHPEQHPMSPGSQGIPMQSPPMQSQYHTAMPLQNLTEGAAPVDCPVCRQRGLTRTDYVSGNTTMGWAAVLCFCLCLGCIPFIMRSLKDVEHHCGKCGVLLATWHNSGRTVVHQHT